ncbi:MAG: hypothetical protein IKN70_13020 [Fibrobacter sp.]|nr:hypothetical protein [Fibrobacter sp.]
MNNALSTGCVDIWLDEIVPCLKDTETGEIKETVVFKIESRSFLRKFREKDGWGINWIDVPGDVEVYALALKENNEIQWLVGVKNDTDVKAAYLHWGCTAPHNNKFAFGKQKYSGVGGHLFAVAVDKSMQWGYDGVIFGFALNKELLNHYIGMLGCSHIGALHPYHFMLGINAAKKLLETYTYEWNGDG